MRLKVRRKLNDYRIKTSLCFGVKTKILLFILWTALILYEIVKHITYRYGQVNAKSNSLTLINNDTEYWHVALLPKYEDSILRYDKIYEEYREREENKEEIKHEDRRRLVWSKCLKYSLHKSGSINHWEFFVDTDHSIIWCNIFKAASSSWMYLFNILGGYEEEFLMKSKDTPLTLARRKFPRPSLDDLETNLAYSTSFMIVREPFERLLSAYRNKLEQYHQTYYRKLSRSIVKLYRNDTKHLFGTIKSYRPTFYEFVRFIIDRYKKDGDRTVFDEHWAPYYRFCSPCQVNFSIIAKVETLDADSEFIIKKADLDFLLLGPSMHMRKKARSMMNRANGGKKTSELVKKYFAQLDEQILTDLIKIYGVDFEMFGYDADKYRKYVRKVKAKSNIISTKAKSNIISQT